MKHQSKLLLTLLHGAGVGALLSSGAMVATDAEAGISNTKHNLGGGLASNTNRVTGGATNEICVFCHTPHGADVTNAEAPPLWNKRLDTAITTYTTYAQLGTSTLDANNATGSAATGSISLACLSCHDGSQAMDNIINAPGSGLWQTDGGGDGGRSGAIWDWAQTSTAGYIGTAVTNLTGDLRNDHPIGIAYCGGNTGSYQSGNTTGCRDSDFKALTDSGNNRWYVDANTSGGKDKSDMILYWRAMGATSAPSVECGSCHDPHVETKSTNQTAFMRISQANSGVCLACHNK